MTAVYFQAIGLVFIYATTAHIRIEGVTRNGHGSESSEIRMIMTTAVIDVAVEVKQKMNHLNKRKSSIRTKLRRAASATMIVASNMKF